MSDATRVLARLALGVHQVEVRLDADEALSLWLDGCLRKARGAGGQAAWLWTNVELPFEDHHLVEVRRAAGAGGDIDVRVNGDHWPVEGAVARPR
jgi:hypothetical protein